MCCGFTAAQLMDGSAGVTPGERVASNRDQSLRRRSQQPRSDHPAAGRATSRVLLNINFLTQKVTYINLYLRDPQRFRCRTPEFTLSCAHDPVFGHRGVARRGKRRCVRQQ